MASCFFGCLRFRDGERWFLRLLGLRPSRSAQDETECCVCLSVWMARVWNRQGPADNICARGDIPAFRLVSPTPAMCSSLIRSPSVRTWSINTTWRLRVAGALVTDLWETGIVGDHGAPAPVYSSLPLLGVPTVGAAQPTVALNMYSTKDKE